MFTRALVIATIALACRAAPVAASTLEGVKDIALHARDGKTVVIGRAIFIPEGDRARFAIELDSKKFTQYFLSMREFKCVEAREILCHVPYPYANPDVVTASDPSWLEHALLFFYKSPADYGAKMSHGIIFTLTATKDGFLGKAQSIDLDEIAIPPDDRSKAFFTPDHRYDIQPGERWFESLTIEPHR
ncbi:hypothetical protein [Rhodoblastus sp.]|uniref:hypothetical protein n=1 Tax=Rhodoblastus sp. TaxID=1962975 RepID=UPI00262E02E6|nr:hypothetical protein [Rhodoblastus sp.]